MSKDCQDKEESQKSAAVLSRDIRALWPPISCRSSLGGFLHWWLLITSPPPFLNCMQCSTCTATYPQETAVQCTTPYWQCTPSNWTAQPWPQTLHWAQRELQLSTTKTSDVQNSALKWSTVHWNTVQCSKKACSVMQCIVASVARCHPPIPLPSICGATAHTQVSHNIWSVLKLDNLKSLW